MKLRALMMSVGVTVMMAGAAQAADAYFTDIKTGGDMDGYAFNVAKTPSVDKALRALLGKEYKEFTARMKTTGPVKRVGDVTCGAGLMPHRGGEDEAAFCVNHKTGNVQVGLMKAKRIDFKGEGKAYHGITDWVENIRKNAPYVR